MSQQTCELCSTPVRVVGHTTKHYEPVGCAECGKKDAEIARLQGELAQHREYHEAMCEEMEAEAERLLETLTDRDSRDNREKG